MRLEWASMRAFICANIWALYNEGRDRSILHVPEFGLGKSTARAHAKC